MSSDFRPCDHSFPRAWHTPTHLQREQTPALSKAHSLKKSFRPRGRSSPKQLLLHHSSRTSCPCPDFPGHMTGLRLQVVCPLCKAVERSSCRPLLAFTSCNLPSSLPPLKRKEGSTETGLKRSRGRGEGTGRNYKEKPRHCTWKAGVTNSFVIS